MNRGLEIWRYKAVDARCAAVEAYSGSAVSSRGAAHDKRVFFNSSQQRSLGERPRTVRSVERHAKCADVKGLLDVRATGELHRCYGTGVSLRDERRWLRTQPGFAAMIERFRGITSPISDWPHLSAHRVREVLMTDTKHWRSRVRTRTPPLVHTVPATFALRFPAPIVPSHDGRTGGSNSTPGPLGIPPSYT